MSLFQQALQSLHSLFCVGAGQTLEERPNQGLSELMTVDTLGQLLIGSWSTMGTEKRIQRLSGHSGRKAFTQDSRVGIQCLVSGVNFATAKILSRCSSSCTSPESCHLNSFDFFELINSAIAPTHNGDRMAFSLLYCAA